jgi:hypothetical protein
MFDDLIQPIGTAKQIAPIMMREVRRVRRSCGIGQPRNRARESFPTLQLTR